MLYQLLTDEFTKFGDKFEKIAHNEANGCTATNARDARRADLLRGVREHLRPKTRREIFITTIRVLRNSVSVLPCASGATNYTPLTKSLSYGQRFRRREFRA